MSEMTPDSFESRLLEIWPRPVWEPFRLVLAVSGGADSSALLAAMARLGDPARLLALHVNHRLRGEESDEDARFTARLAEKYAVPFREERIDPDELRRAAVAAGSLEAGAREIRYRLLLRGAESFGARFVLTAHHAGDQAETVLYRLFRGSGIDGLAGMSRLRPLSEAVVLARPFLSFSRDELTEYLTRLGETWRHDSSNDSSLFLRNRIRHELVPLLNDLFGGRAIPSVLKLADRAAEIRTYLDDRLDAELASFGGTVSDGGDGTGGFSAAALSRLDPLLLTVWFRRLWNRRGWPMGEMDAARWNGLVQMVREGADARRELPGGLSVEIRDGRLLISRKG
ncbi:MAG: tRNA lysidine(34) synthetase TilS [Thermoguttaceae bacterium]|nr:tRNA lysidine(34) synthetase TilS [Thermoguttaceae bacterium]